MLKFILDVFNNPGILTAAAVVFVAISVEKQKKEIGRLKERLKIVPLPGLRPGETFNGARAYQPGG